MVKLLACWKGQFGKRDRNVWKENPLCLIWCIWRESNEHTFEGNEISVDKLKSLFLMTWENRCMLLPQFS